MLVHGKRLTKTKFYGILNTQRRKAMNDTTIDWKIAQIKKYSNKNHWRVRQFVKDINLIISNYRLLAYQKRGTYVGTFCSRESNYLEAKLNSALGITK